MTEPDHPGPPTLMQDLNQRLLVNLVLAVVAVWLLFRILVIAAPLWSSFSLEGSAQLGESFGSLNTLFSGLAFAALIVVLLMQRRDLELLRVQMESQLEELRLHRSEMNETQSIMEDQMRLQLLAAKLSSLAQLSEHYQAEAMERYNFTMNNIQRAPQQTRNLRLRTSIDDFAEEAVPSYRSFQRNMVHSRKCREEIEKILRELNVNIPSTGPAPEELDVSDQNLLEELREIVKREWSR